MIESNSLAFNSASGDGYNKSVKHSPRDIMSVDVSAPPPSIENLFNKITSSLGFAKNDPTYNQPEEDVDPKETLMEKLHPDTSYEGPDFNKQDNMRDASKVVKDGEKVSQRTDFAKQENDEQKENLREDFETDKNVAVEALKEAAIESGVDPSVAVDTMVSGGESTKATAASAIFAEAATGGMGSLATAGKAATVTVVASKEDQKLSPDEQRALLEDTLRTLQSSSSQDDTRLAASTSGGAANNEDAPAPESDAQWENITVEDLEELLSSDVEDLPEWEALSEIENDIEEVLDNHRFVAANYSTTGDLIAKAEAAAESGQSHVLKDELESSRVAVNSGDVEIAGAGLTGIVAMKVPDDVAVSAARFDSVVDARERFVAVQATEVETRYDQSRMNMNVVGEQLDGVIGQQFAASLSA